MTTCSARDGHRQETLRTRRAFAITGLILGVVVIPGNAQAQCGTPPSCFGQAATIYVAGGVTCGGPNHLTPYGGTLEGTAADDVMVGTETSDTINGQAGNDRLCGLGGNDTLDGGAGDDNLDAGDGDDVIIGGLNADLILGGRGNDNIQGGDGIDILCGQNDDDTIAGDLSADLIDGSVGIDSLDGGDGVDTCLEGESLIGCELTVGVIPQCGTPLPTLTPTSTPTQTNTSTPTNSATPTRTPGPCTAPAPNNACIPGGGSSRTDCAVEWIAAPVPLLKNGAPVADVRNGIQRNRLYCYDGDERCDFDGQKDNDSCTFHAALCINNDDPRLPQCNQSALATFEVKKPRPDRPKDAADTQNLTTLETQFGAAPGFGVTVVRRNAVIHTGEPNIDEDLCSGNLELVVPLRITTSGTARRAKKVIRFKATDVFGARDSDSMKLECRPSTCGNNVIEDDHEQCDDGNRNNGDGCNQACQREGASTPTHTAVPAATSTATNTAPPASTNTPPSTPTSTPLGAATSTATATQSAGGIVLVGIAPGGGTTGNCRGTCIGGSNAGASCSANDECPGSSCSPTMACSGGSNNGNACTGAAQCPGGSCVPARTCVGGGYDGFSCSAASNCNGCDPSRICRASGDPLACCTGNQAGDCPLRGSCAVIQGTLQIRLSLNGICLPRSYPPGDLDCTTDAECRTCVGGANDGKACRQASHCPSGTCSSPGFCQLAEIGAEVGAQQPNGERSMTLRQETLVLNAAYVSPIGTACVSAGGDGTGVLDCDGGRPGLNFTLKKDHNTSPSNPGNGGSANGLPDDPGCDDTSTAVDGSTTYTCVEGSRQCSGGVNAGEACGNDAECPGSVCGFCNIGTNGGPHTGVCNSPTVAETAGTLASGDAALALPLAITLLDAKSDPPPADYGADGLPCTADDTAPPGNPVLVALSTGTNSIFIYDRTNTARSVLGPGQSCGLSQCAAQVTGQGLSCAAVDTGSLEGLILGGGFPALDSQIGDIATTFQFTLEDRP